MVHVGDRNNQWLRKRRIRKHVIADLGVNFVERYVLLNGFVAQRVRNDYGYDLNVNTFNTTGEFEPGIIYIQIKATDKLKKLKNKNVISFSIERKDLLTWYVEAAPVILVIYDAKKNKAYWVYIQQYLKNLDGFDISRIPKYMSIHISLTNRLVKKSFREIRKYKASIQKQISNVIVTY